MACSEHIRSPDFGCCIRARNENYKMLRQVPCHHVHMNPYDRFQGTKQTQTPQIVHASGLDSHVFRHNITTVAIKCSQATGSFKRHASSCVIGHPWPSIFSKAVKCRPLCLNQVIRSVLVKRGNTPSFEYFGHLSGFWLTTKHWSANLVAFVSSYSASYFALFPASHLVRKEFGSQLLFKTLRSASTSRSEVSSVNVSMLSCLSRSLAVSMS